MTEKLLKKLLCVHCSHPKVNNHGLKKKKKKEAQNVDVGSAKRASQMHTKLHFFSYILHASKILK